MLCEICGDDEVARWRARAALGLRKSDFSSSVLLNNICLFIYVEKQAMFTGKYTKQNSKMLPGSQSW